MGKYLVDFILHPVAETVDGNEIRLLISCKPDIMDVTVKELFNFPAGVDVVHILQYPHQFFEEKERFGWDCKDENVSLS